MHARDRICSVMLLQSLEMKGNRVRLIGVGVSNLSENIERQATLPFGRAKTAEQEEKRRRAMKVLDEVKRKMGEGAIDRGDIKR